MAQNISLMGAAYPNVPSVLLPKTGGGQASFVDVTGASLSSSDGVKILAGETAYGNDWELINGTAPDYNDFATYIIKSFNYQVTPSADTYAFPLPACDLGGRPIKWIQIFGNPGNISTTSTATQRDYVTGLTYTDDALLKINYAAKMMAVTIRVARSSTTATAKGSVYGSSYFSIENESLLASGGATIRVDTSKTTNLYFKGGVLHYVAIGG